MNINHDQIRTIKEALKLACSINDSEFENLHSCSGNEAAQRAIRAVNNGRRFRALLQLLESQGISSAAPTSIKSI